MSTPEVITVVPGERWVVASHSIPGAFWDVTYRPEVYAVIGGRERTRLELRCRCPHGRAQVELPLDERTECRHLKAAVIAAAPRPRPVYPANVAALVD